MKREPVIHKLTVYRTKTTRYTQCQINAPNERTTNLWRKVTCKNCLKQKDKSPKYTHCTVKNTSYAVQQKRWTDW